MAISVTAPVTRFTAAIGRSGSFASSSFTPADNSLLVCCVNWDEVPGADDQTHNINLTSTGLIWTQRVLRHVGESGATTGGAAIYTAPVGTGASITVSVARDTTGYNSTERHSAQVYVVTGEHASPIGAVGEGSSTTNNLSPTLFTGTGAGRAFYCGTDWAQQGMPTSTDIEDGGDYAGFISCMSAYKASDHTAGAVTGNLDGGGTSACNWNWVALEILADTSAQAATSLHPELLSRSSRSHILMR